MADELNKDIKLKFIADINDAKKKIDKLEKELQDVSDDAKKVGQDGKQGFDKLGSAAKKAETDVTAIGVATLNAAAGITGMSDAVFGFREKLVALERSKFGLSVTTRDLNREVEDLNEALREGTITGIELERRLEDLQFAYRDMRIEQAEVREETNALNGEFVTFGVSSVQAITSIITAMGVMGIKSKAAFISAVAGVKIFNTSLWSIIKHPVFLAVSAAILVWESNFLSLRSTVENAFGGADLGILSNIEKGFDMAFGKDQIDDLDEMNLSYEEMGLNLKDVQSGLRGVNEENTLLSGSSGNVSALNSLYHEMAREAAEAEKAVKSLTTASIGFRQASGFSLASGVGGGGIGGGSGGGSSRGFDPFSSQRAQVAAADAQRRHDALLGGSSRGRGGITDSILNRLHSVLNKGKIDIQSRFGEVTEFIKIITEADNLRTANDMFDQAVFEASNGNLEGALILEREAQKLGRSSTNKSGFLTMTADSMREAGRIKSRFTNSNRVFGLSTGMTLSKDLGIGGLTRSSRRRRAPNGKPGPRSARRALFGASRNIQGRLNSEFGFNFFDFAFDTGELQNKFGNVRFGRRTPSSARQSAHSLRLHRINQGLGLFANQERIGRQRIGRFQGVTAGAEMEEALVLLNQGFGSTRFDVFDPGFKHVKQVQEVIQARNFFRNKSVDFDGMEKSGVSGLLNIREFGYREMNEQLAFQGEEQFQTVGT